METELTYGSDYHGLPVTSIRSGDGMEIVPDVYAVTVQIVNVIFVGLPGSREWVLVDAGMPGSADTILSASESRFGAGSRPQAIVLTHGHFDHVGAVIELVEAWDVPVYAHEKELPFLTGKAAYPPADPRVSSGLVARMSPWFPNEPIHLGDRARPLPSDGTVPGMPEWRWLPTPGHTIGHVSLFRSADRVLIAGDAFVTVNQESLYKVFTQTMEIGGPPQYFTTDWPKARESVAALEALKPDHAVTGHGIPLSGSELAENLKLLVDEFDRIAVPEHGKYV
ncbi:MBL fold metallo-hydrolase [Cohnella sp. AR92]|uniref:MBL fold metallo-hydrolase n=1 Tax=Cohnella sp. AR92 TaxID=648716 RepID=UPI000F8E3A1B|nr:MBL fold metallo-hydrolase [Cohnella sp. AR92]RUS45100.1 MBL fold metallo-hydrolase [Cohnella sp. AR92]